MSKRWLYKDQYFAFASRHDPMFPFEYMKIIWLYVPKKDGVEMIWIQDFKMDAKAKFNDAQAEEMINKHSGENLKRFKEIIEKESGKKCCCS